MRERRGGEGAGGRAGARERDAGEGRSRSGEIKEDVESQDRLK